jgi:rhodanese-related sulfurtransferase
MSQVEGRVDEVSRDQAVVVVCRSGGRSNAIALLLNSRGVNAVNLSGGMHAWEQAGLPVVTETGAPGRVI